jgi:hypothetical protein
MTRQRGKSDEFRVVVSSAGIEATYHVAGGAGRSVGDRQRLPASDSLVMQTVQLLDTWLNLWDQIDVKRAENRKMILSDRTLRIIGQHLWSLILAKPVGDELKGLIRSGRPLRVLITFRDGPGDRESAAYETLKGLPWEFICTDDSQPIFLAAEAKLQLARYVQLPDIDDGPPFSGTASLRVQFVTALPMTRGFAYIWEQVRQFREAVDDPDAHIEAPEPVQGIDLDAIKTALSVPFHVIHLVGLCKGSPGQPRMYLQSEGDPWQPPRKLIEALTPDDVPRPQLVILHLCEVEEGDASENFERLAPALIERGVPAVLALQYPMAVEPNVAIGKRFYKKLANGESIGAAVQSSRHEMLGGEGRNFGTPVLYLQQDRVVVKINPKQQEAGTKQTPPPDAGTAPGEEVLATLSQALFLADDLDLDKARIVLKELNPYLSVGAQPDVALQFLLSTHVDPEVRQVIEYLLEVLRSPQRGSDDVPATPVKQGARKPAQTFVRAQRG